MTDLDIALLGLQAALLAATGLAITLACARASASLRRFVLVVTLGAIAALPVARALAPRLDLFPELAATTAPAVPLFDDPVVPRTTGEAPAERPGQVAASLAAPAWTPSLFHLWLAGALLLAGRSARSHVLSRRLRRRSVALDHPIALQELATAARDQGIPAPSLATSADLAVPGVVGLRHPTVLAPKDASGWSRERWRSVLGHEVAHIVHRDGWVNSFASIVLAAHWMNPLVWLVVRRLRFEQELAADDAVLRSGVRASEYASHLLACARGEAPALVTALVRRPALSRRIEALLDRKRPRRPLALARAIAVAATGATILAALACAIPGDPDRARDPEPSTPAAGSSTLVPAHQTIADSEIDRLQQELSPEAAAVIVLDPADGAILAVSSRSRVAGPDVALERRSVPGSTFKLLAIGAALEERAITDDQRFACGRRAYGDEVLTDVGEFGTLALPELVAVSSNVGISHVFDALGPERYGRWLARFHIERPAAIGEGLPAAVLAIGQKLPIRPIELSAIYATIANRGRYNPPTRERRAAVNEPVLSAATAQTLLRLLEGVVTDPRGTGRAAAIPGVRVAGKTGTADVGGGRQWASFAGIVPADAPRFVVFVGIEGPADRVTGGRTAAPAFARIATRLLGR